MTAIIIILLIFASCPKSNECGRSFYISGKVTDQNGVPLENVEVHSVDPFNYDVIQVTTNASGDYSHLIGTYSDLGSTYIYFRKSGFQDLTTSPVIGKGNGACGDQQIIRDGVMVP
mgnify:FL=1